MFSRAHVAWTDRVSNHNALTHIHIYRKTHMFKESFTGWEDTLFTVVDAPFRTMDAVAIRDLDEDSLFSEMELRLDNCLTVLRSLVSLTFLRLDELFSEVLPSNKCSEMQLLSPSSKDLWLDTELWPSTCSWDTEESDVEPCPVFLWETNLSSGDLNFHVGALSDCPWL